MAKSEKRLKEIVEELDMENEEYNRILTNNILGLIYTHERESPMTPEMIIKKYDSNEIKI